MTRSSRDESIHHHKHNRLPGVGQHKKKKKTEMAKNEKGRGEAREGRGGRGRTDGRVGRVERATDNENTNKTPDPDERPLSSLNSSGSTPGALYGVAQHGKGPASRSSTPTRT